MRPSQIWSFTEVSKSSAYSNRGFIIGKDYRQNCRGKRHQSEGQNEAGGVSEMSPKGATWDQLNHPSHELCLFSDNIKYST